jgi:hypothetical protein
LKLPVFREQSKPHCRAQSLAHTICKTQPSFLPKYAALLTNCVTMSFLAAYAQLCRGCAALSRRLSKNGRPMQSAYNRSEHFLRRLKVYMGPAQFVYAAEDGLCPWRPPRLRVGARRRVGSTRRRRRRTGLGNPGSIQPGGVCLIHRKS